MYTLKNKNDITQQRQQATAKAAATSDKSDKPSLQI
jgi:hypothetical protein